MAQPTIAKRLQRRFIVMTADEAMLDAVRRLTPENWEMVPVTDLEDLGDWHDVLLFRFLLLDLDEIDAFDPIDVIRQIRMEYQINLHVFCFGGEADIREEMRLARADRFFGRQEMLERLPVIFQQYP